MHFKVKKSILILLHLAVFVASLFENNKYFGPDPQERCVKSGYYDSNTKKIIENPSSLSKKRIRKKRDDLLLKLILATTPISRYTKKRENITINQMLKKYLK
ncbi:UNVERIFIED_CONTAM: hypothetical protein RMT77_018456 [Armadillidium vulgare]